MTKIRFVCCDCGGDNIVVDGFASWSVEKQDWVLANVFEEAFCADCDTSTSIAEEEIVGESQ